MQIPDKNKRWIQPNRGDSFGNLFATFNMDFDVVQGKVRVAPRLRIGTDEVDDVSLTLPTAFVRSTADLTDKWWALCGTTLFKTSGTDPSAAFTQDANASSPTNATTLASDMIEFNNKLYVSLNTNITELDGAVSSTWDVDWWTTVPRGTALTTAIPHPMHVTIKTNLFLVGDGNLLHVMDKNENVSNSRIILPSEFQIMWIRSSKEGTWIGARHTANGEAKVFFWDESAENYNRAYGVKSDNTFAGLIKNGICHTINNAGQLLRFDGSGFAEIAVFPVFEQINKRWYTGTNNLVSVHRNGMAVIDEEISILVNSEVNNNIADVLVNFPSGVWTFNENEGLRHKYSLSQYDGTEIDYGTFITEDVGALVPTTANQGLFLAGGDIFTSASATLNAIFFRDETDSIVKRGHFTTSVFEASSVEDIFQDLLVWFKRFRSSSDRIIIKYRVIKDPNYPIVGGGTWSDTDTFTSTDTLTNAVAGDEVFIIRGRGSGTLLTIGSISEAGGTFTVNLTETTPNVSGTFAFIIDNWTLAATVSIQGIERQQFDLDVPGTWIQLKVELRSASGSAGAGDSPELEKIEVRQKPDEVI
ncbi:hypothetical protein IID22_02105 [Patescibacteria group bacterium]|nr:hypothetical protein [Patescibacteria group bacterium]